MSSRPRATLTLLFLLGAACALNAPGITWGLPSQYGWAPDEVLPETVLEGLPQGFSAGWAHKYPPFHFTLLGLLYRPVLWAHGLRAGDAIPGDVYFALFLLGRALSLTMAAGCVLLVHACGRRLLDRRGALFAALLTATLLPFVFYAKLANLDVPYLFWSLLSLLFALRALERPGALDLSLFGLTGMLAIATKDQAYGLYVLGAPLLLLARARRLSRSGGPWRASFARDLALATLAAAAAFTFGFGLLGNWAGFVEHLRLITGPASDDFQLFPATLAGQLDLLRHSAFQLAFVLGPPAAAVCALGVGSVAARLLGLLAPPRTSDTRGPDDWRLLGLLVPALSYYATFIAVVLYSYDRFLLPVAVLLTFFGGRVLSEATSWPGWQGRLGRVVAAVVIGYGAARGASLDALMLNDARYAAETFLRAQVAPDEDVAGIGALSRLPRLDGARWSVLPPSAAALEEARPEWVVVNADLARSMRAGGAKARFYERLRAGDLGYRLVHTASWRAPFLFFDADRLSRGAYGPVLSNLEVVNSPVELYRRVAPAR